MLPGPMSQTPEILHSDGPEQTRRLGEGLAARLGAGDCVALIGPLGAGKTALTRGLAIGLGLADERMVSSPTYVLVQEYPGRVPVFHPDLYRMGDAAAELSDLGLDEMLAEGVAIIEWADRAEGSLPRPLWRIEIRITGPSTREIHVQRVV